MPSPQTPGLNLSLALNVFSKTALVRRLRIFRRHQGLAATSRRRVHFSFQTAERSIFKLKQRLTFNVNSINQRGHEAFKRRPVYKRMPP